MKTISFILWCFIINGWTQADDTMTRELTALPLETVLIRPVLITNACIWVPAVKSGPFVNRSCRAQQDQTASSMLPASVKHQKDPNCPAESARILAELISKYHEKSLPLTIFNGWQWEYSYSLCQYENTNYILPERGGCWENCQEAVLNISAGQMIVSWLYMCPADIAHLQPCKEKNTKSTLYITTFSFMRTRDGYPKERKL